MFLKKLLIYLLHTECKCQFCYILWC